MALHRLLTPPTALLADPIEARVFADRRRRLLSRARGRVLELGGSLGRNVSHYPPDDVDLVVQLAPRATGKPVVLNRVAAAPVRVEVHEAVAEEVKFEDGWFDTIVSTLALCSVPDIRTTIAAVKRLLAPEGQLLFLEHSRATGVVGAVQRAASPVWQRVGWCRLDREPLAELRAGGLFVGDCDRFSILPAPLGIGGWVQGVAGHRAASGAAA